jgi:peptide/nickel transport system substrate-binding protein
MPHRTSGLLLSRRAFLTRLAAGGAALGLLSACGGGSSGGGGAAVPPPAAPAATAETRVNVPQSISTAAPASAAAQPAAAPASGRPQPTGQFNYVWHTTISPAWFDPQENPPQITPYNFAYALHDALVKHMPGQPFAPSLAESYEVAPDSLSATFKLRQGIKFHNGDAVTPEDVQFTFEQYRGANAKILHDKTSRIDLVDDRTIQFHFKSPFLDFLTLYGCAASGAGWVVPKAYYQKVGPDGFKQQPIGAGPYRFVSQQSGTQVVFEAFTDYWRKTPNVKTLVMRGVAEDSTRVALLQTGDADVANLIPGQLLDAVRRDPKLRLAPVKAGPVWLELGALDGPDSPLKDIRVRQAVSLTLDRKAINDAEQGGLGLFEGNWVPEDWPGTLARPQPPFDLAKAKQLMAEAGVAEGFEVSKITPLPPYSSWAERIASQLRAINIRTQVNNMERGAFYERLAPGPNRLSGFVMQLSGEPGDAAARLRENATCDGPFSGICIPDVSDRIQRYDASVDPQERKKLLDEAQTYLLDNYLMVPVLRQALIHGLGPRLANPVEEIEGAIPQYVYTGPWEDVRLNA